MPLSSSSTTDGSTQPNKTWDRKDGVFSTVGIGPALYQDAGGGLRFRQHVNPLKRELQIPAQPLDWEAVYQDPTLPLLVDIGCGYGRFLLAHLSSTPGYNGLGMEIRGPIVERANGWATTLNLHTRARFMVANATCSFFPVLSTYPGPISLVTIQYPDPHFKKRHRKRRTVQPQLVEGIATLVAPGGHVLLQSDVKEVAEHMRDQFEQYSSVSECFELDQVHFQPNAVFFSYEGNDSDGNDEGSNADDTTDTSTSTDTPIAWESVWARKGGWLRDNPLPVPTERELHVLGQGLPVYRVLLVRKK